MNTKLFVCVGGVLLGSLAACRSGAEREYWWEEGYPYSEGTARATSGDAPVAYARPAPGPATRPSATGSNAVLARLRKTSVSGLSIQDEESLTAAVEALRTSTGLPLVVDPAAETAALDEGAVFDLVLTNPLSARHVLDLIVEQAGPEVGWTIRHEAIIVTTREKSRGGVVVKAHDMRALVAARTDFIAPRLDRVRLIDDLEDEDGGSPFGSLEQAGPRYEEDDIVTLVQENVAVGSWEDEGISISGENGVLLVTHTPAVQLQVADFLSALAGF